MQSIRLPHHLNELDLEALNQRLHANEIRLDWTEVEPNIPPTSLERLFAGMNLLDFIDAIGSDTMPERLLPEIQAAFAIVEAQTQTSHIIANDDKHNESTPALWLPEKSHAVLSPSPLNEPVEDVPILEAVPLVETDTPLPIQPTRPLLAAPSPAQMREELEEMVLRDLLGPAGGEDEEVNEDRVRDRYLVGMLAPGKTQTIPEEHEPLADAETGGPDEGAEDEDTAQKASFNPASLGMSFSVDGKTTELLVSVRWGQYKRTESESSKTSHGKPKRIWKRTQRGGDTTVALV